MLLSDRDILAELDAKRVQLDPFDAAMVQPSSVDVRLDRFFRVFENHRYPHIDPAEEQPDLTRMVEPEGEEPFILHPGEFVLGWPGMKIGQLCFFRLSSPAEHPYGSEKYGSRYQGQRGPTPSRSYKNFHRTDV